MGGSRRQFSQVFSTSSECLLLFGLEGFLHSSKALLKATFEKGKISLVFQKLPEKKKIVIFSCQIFVWQLRGSEINDVGWVVGLLQNEAKRTSSHRWKTGGQWRGRCAGEKKSNRRKEGVKEGRAQEEGGRG